MRTIGTTCALLAAAMISSASAEVLTTMVVYVAADGTALGGPVITDTVSSVVNYPLGLTKRDKKGLTVFANKQPPELTASAHLLAYDGKLAVFYDAETTRMSAYKMDAAGFVLVGTHDHKLLWGSMEYPRVWLAPSEIVVMPVEFVMPRKRGDASSKATVFISVTAFDRKLSKTKWKTPNVDDGSLRFRWLGDGVVQYQVGTTITFYRRGKVLATHTVPLGTGVAPGKDGSLVYFHGIASTTTITFCSKKGAVVSSLTLAQMTDHWIPMPMLNHDMFYTVDSFAPHTNTIYVYKLGKRIELVRSVTTTDPECRNYDIDGTSVYGVFPAMIDNQHCDKVIVYSRDLEKQLWSNESSPGGVFRSPSKGVYCRINETAISIALELFSKKGVMVTHVFAKL